MDAIVQAVRDGHTRSAAAGAGGIDHSTLTAWAERYPGFSHELGLAEAEAERRHVKNLCDAGADDWRASAHWLKVRRPNDWAPPEKTQVEFNGTIAIEFVNDWRGNGAPTPED